MAREKAARLLTKHDDKYSEKTSELTRVFEE
jgi:hypothetical protein